MTYSWSADINSGGRSSTVTIDNQQVAASGSTTREGLAPNSQACATITITNSEGQHVTNQACGTTWPAPVASERRGATSTLCPRTWGSCNVYEVQFRHYRPNSVVECHLPNTTGENGYTQIRMDANGSWGWGQYKNWVVGQQDISGDITRYCTQK